MERKRKRKGKMDEQISIEPTECLTADSSIPRYLNATLEALGNSKSIFKSPIRLFSLPASSYHDGNLLSVYLSNHLKVHQDSTGNPHHRKRRREEDDQGVHEMHDGYQGSPQGYDQAFDYAQDDNGLHFGAPVGQQEMPIEIER